jgi:hypothetical protein
MLAFAKEMQVERPEYGAERERITIGPLRAVVAGEGQLVAKALGRVFQHCLKETSLVNRHCLP